MYGINAGYDTRPMATGAADTGVSVKSRSTVFFQQAAVNAEAAFDRVMREDEAVVAEKAAVLDW